MSDVWAHCPECDRWFYPTESGEEYGPLGRSGAMGGADPAAEGGAVPQTARVHSEGSATAPGLDAGAREGHDSDGLEHARCPVCSVRPDRLEDRSEDPSDSQDALRTRATA